ncbi:hypothetical protein TNCV_2413341 [Trichonephila clavipes]|nr:hypothetical protein TNCV_2413341 [Trichonephila clavipes]
MVWGAIIYDSRSTLIVMRGTLTGQRYVDDILRPHVGPFLNGLSGTKFSSKIVRHLKKSDPNFYDLLVLFFQSRSMISMKVSTPIRTRFFEFRDLWLAATAMQIERVFKLGSC